MSTNLGDICYNENEFLNHGANYPKPNDIKEYAGIAQLHIIDLKEPEDNIYKSTDNTEDIRHFT